MKEIIYNESLEQLNRILSEYKKGEFSVICPTCKSKVIVVIDAEDVAATKRGLGIYCPNKHFGKNFNFR